jgi:RNA polymerase sigma factor (TIGR02999 family)
MSEVTRILSAIEQGDPHAAEQLLPLVYDELRKLAAQKLAQEKPGQTLQATALVHEAYIRLVDVEKMQRWDSRGHFFAAAAEAMRRILVESVRRHQAQKRGGGHGRIDLPDIAGKAVEEPVDLLALDEALVKLQEKHPQRAIEVESSEDRAAFLDQACRGNTNLRTEVEKLVVDYFRAGNFLEKPLARLAATVRDHPINECPGAIIGPYKLLEQIGEGGFGVVFMAEQQQPLRRKVALKIIKPGMDTRQVIARFEAERQALALMDHRNIARVIDGGETAAGRPYFVMELVKGKSVALHAGSAGHGGEIRTAAPGVGSGTLGG